MLLSIKDISVAFNSLSLLNSAEFGIKDKEKIGFVGRNGSGKSTLLKIIAGHLIPDRGEIFIRKGCSIGYLCQDIPVLSGNVYQIAASAFNLEGKAMEEYRRQNLMEKPDRDLLVELKTCLDNYDAWPRIKQTDIILNSLGLDPNAEYSGLSDGMKRRTILARELVRESDVLLLDEPTNHLDICSILWLEDYLRKYQKSIILVTHDRSFLQSVVDTIYELDRGRLIYYNCGYQGFIEQKEGRLLEEEERNRIFDKKLEAEQAWFRKGIKARRTRNEGRVRALEKLRLERGQRRDILDEAGFFTQKVSLSGKKVISARKISFAYGDRPIIKDFSTTIMRNDKVAILGRNGCGKTTLIKLLLKELNPRKGIVEHGTKLTVSYFDQNRMGLEPKLSLIDNINGGNDSVWFNGRHINIFSYLQNFLFSREQMGQKAEYLSGGEKNRLLLAKLFSIPANLLVLDEPTNDLDTETLELLENILTEFEGTVIIVSHDRTFVNNVVTSSIIFQNDGSIVEFTGGYENWQMEKIEERSKPGKSKKDKKHNIRERKISFKEKQELNDLPDLIEKLEEEQQKLINLMSTPEFFKNPPDEIKLTKQRLMELDDILEHKYCRWQELDDLSCR